MAADPAYLVDQHPVTLEWHWFMVAKNGRAVAVSLGYRSRKKAINGAKGFYTFVKQLDDCPVVIPKKRTRKIAGTLADMIMQAISSVPKRKQ